MQEPVLTVHPDAVVVTVHEATVVYVPEHRELFELSLHAASLVSAVSDGDPGLLPQDLGGEAIDQLVDQLLALGVLHESDPRSSAR